LIGHFHGVKRDIIPTFPWTLLKVLYQNQKNILLSSFDMNMHITRRMQKIFYSLLLIMVERIRFHIAKRKKEKANVCQEFQERELQLPHVPT